MRFSILVLTLWVALGRIGLAAGPDPVSELVEQVLRAQGQTWEANTPADGRADSDAEEAPKEDTRPVMRYYTAVAEDAEPPFQSWCAPCNAQAKRWHDWQQTHSLDDLPFQIDHMGAVGAVPRFEWQGANGKTYKHTGQVTIDSLLWQFKKTTTPAASTEVLPIAPNNNTRQ